VREAEASVVVGLGLVDPELVKPVLSGRCRFVPRPSDADLAHVEGAIARRIAVVITPGAGTTAVADGAIGMAMHLPGATAPAQTPSTMPWRSPT
jgi:D-3-phosphoglycerate dehydrogenase